jgi:hypothetical protein
VELYIHSPNTPSWRGAQLKKHRDNFTFTRLRIAYKILVEKPEGRRPLGIPRHCWMIILKWLLKKYDMNVWTGSKRELGIESEHFNETSGFRKGE